MAATLNVYAGQTPAAVVVQIHHSAIRTNHLDKVLVQVIAVARGGGLPVKLRWVIVGFLINRIVFENMRAPTRRRQGDQVAISIVLITNLTAIRELLSGDTSGGIIFKAGFPTEGIGDS